MRTKEEIFKDTDETLFFIKCKLSFKFFVENVVGLIPDTYQLDWVDTLETNDRLSVIASTGHGKTACMGSWYILWKLFTKSNWHALIVSNSLNQAKKILADIVEIIDNNEVLKDLKGNKEIDNTTQFNTRNRCRVFCAPNSKNVRGVHVDYVLADEASAYDDHDVFFRYIETRAVAKQGKLCAISTLSDANDLMSKLRNNPQYKTVITACYNKDGTPSSHRFSVEQLLGIKLTIGELAFRKEYLCDVSVVLDAIYPPDLVSSCFDNNIAFSLNKDDYKGLIYMGCDFAYSATGDYTVFTVVDVFNNIITIRHMERHRGMPISEQTDRIRALYQMLDPASILVDGSNFGQAIAKELINDGLPIYEQNFAPIHRQHLLQYLKHRMESGKIVIPHKDDINTTHIIDQLKLELTSFKVKKTPAGAVTFQASSAHDDCLDGETLIKSMRGWIKIKDIKTGDLVLTHKNRYKKVLTCNKRLMKDNETMYSIITTGRPALEITGTHPLYVAEKKTNNKQKPIIYKNVNVNLNCCYYNNEQWVTTKELKPNKHSTIYPINKYSKLFNIDLSKYAPKSYCIENGYLISYIRSPITAFTKLINPKSNKLKQNIIVDKHFGRILGYFAAEGTTGRHNFSFSSHKDEIGIRDYVNLYFTNMGLNLSKQTRGNGTSSSFGSMILRNFFNENFGKGPIKKYPLFVETLPIDIQKQIIIGHAIGDGSFTKGYFSLNTISKIMAYQLFDMFSRCGYIVSLKRRNGQNGHHTQWCISMGIPETNKFLKSIPKDLLVGKTVNVKSVKNNQTQLKKYNNYLYSPIRKIIETKQKKYVYNLQVDDDESYVANGYIVHNCAISFALSVKASMAYQPFESFIATEYKELTKKEKQRTNTNLIKSL